VKMNHKDKVEWRRDQIQQLLAKGHYSCREISSILHISKTTINRDIQFLNQEAKNTIIKYIEDRFPAEYNNVLFGVNAVLRESWDIVNQSNDAKEKIQALSLIQDGYAMKMDLLTNVDVVSDAARFVSSHNNSNNNSIEISQSRRNDSPKQEQSSTTTDDNDEEPPTTNKVF
jgi:HTH domain